MVGQTISHYKIVERLGGGGMGVVFKAVDLHLDRYVALKFLPASLDSGEEWKKRFTQEAKAASSLDHPNICTIHHIGQTPEGQMYIVMGYYPGETLTAKIQRGPLPLREAVGIAIQAASGLVKAHASGIVHRDVKPANMIVTTDGVVKILDFGLALLAEDTRITVPGSRLGTPAYMSPEQAQGADVDHRTDIWSLGVVVYEMISGKLPFKGTYDVAIIYSVINEDPEPIGESGKDMPVEIHRVISRALTKDPIGRYQTAQEMLADLDAIAARLDAAALTVEIPREAPKKPANKRVMAGIAAAAAVAIGAGVYFTFSGNSAEQGIEERAAAVSPAAPTEAPPGADLDEPAGEEASSGGAPSVPVEPAPAEPARASRAGSSRGGTKSNVRAAASASADRENAPQAAPAPAEPVTRPPSAAVEPTSAPAPASEVREETPPPAAPAPEQVSPPSTRSQPPARETAVAPPPPVVEPAPKRQESTELSDWARVRDSSDPEAFEAFLNKYPNGTLRQEALARVEELKWTRARAAGNAAALREFLREFPGGRHSAEAEALAAKLEASSSDSSAVLQTVQRFAAAYQQRNVKAIAAVWPNLAAAQLASIGNSLRDARSVRYELRPLGDPEISNGTAKIACRRSLQFEFAQGAQQAIEDKVSITLRKRGENWFIEGVQTR